MRMMKEKQTKNTNPTYRGSRQILHVQHFGMRHRN